MHKQGFVPIVALIVALAALGGGAYYINSHEPGSATNESDTAFVYEESEVAATTTATATLETTEPNTSTVATSDSTQKPNTQVSSIQRTVAVSSNSNNSNVSSVATVLQPVVVQPSEPVRPPRSTPNVRPSSSSVTSNNAIIVTLPNGREDLRAGGTYNIEWEPRNSINSRRFSDFKVELVEVGRIDKGPVLIASYANTDIDDLPRSVNVTLPLNMNVNTWYAIKATYKTSNTNYFGDEGYDGFTYSGVSPSFRVEPANTSAQGGVTNTTSNQSTADGSLELSSRTLTTQPVKEKDTNVPLVRFEITADDSAALLTHLAIGSLTGNEVFNYVENVKAQVNGQVIPLSFSNEYLLGTTLWKLDRALSINAGASVTMTIVADIKPGIKDTTLRASVKGGRANVPVSGSVTGPTVEVD